MKLKSIKKNKKKPSIFLVYLCQSHFLTRGWLFCKVWILLYPEMQRRKYDWFFSSSNWIGRANTVEQSRIRKINNKKTWSKTYSHMLSLTILKRMNITGRDKLNKGSRNVGKLAIILVYSSQSYLLTRGRLFRIKACSCVTGNAETICAK